ncbi:MAG: hypothetical protein HYZ91_00100 [Candidatus Omnitrophica bacterium]|nr:hypothetical protein [Candidatus Omnitrophota bacterium]
MNIHSQTSHRLGADLLKALPDLLPSLKIIRADRGSGSRACPDLVVEVRTPSGRKRRLCVEARAAGSPSRIPHVIRQLHAERPRRAGYPVVASQFLSPRARELCREAGVGYLDLAGNCHLQFDDFYYQKVVDRNPFPHRGRPPSLFSPVSSRILRALLEEPSRSWRVSEVAAVADVSLGQASNVCRRLIDDAYARAEHRRVTLTQPATLLEAWRERYTIDQHAPFAYYSFERDPSRLLQRLAQVAVARRWRYAATSFSAAMLIAPFVQGIGTVQWFMDETSAPEEWVAAMDLRPVEAGANVWLRRAADAGVFYRTQTVQGVTLVGNVQLYLDLYSDPARGKEQAEFLRAERMEF